MPNNSLICKWRLGSRVSGFMIAALAASVAAAQAQDPIAMEKADVAAAAADSPGDWTPENLLGAQLLPLPIVEGEVPASASLPEVPLEESHETVSGAYAEVEPDLSSSLFTGERPLPSEQEVMPENAGTSGAYFSSSQLIPENARLEFPYRINGKLFFRQPSGSFICSGTVIKPRLILTAGHCVHSGSDGSEGFYSDFLFVPAYHRGQAPYQAWNWTWVVTSASWSASGGAVPNSADLAIIEVEDRQFASETKTIGEVVGWAGFRTNALFPNHTKKLGYPGNHDGGEVMHQVDSGAHALGDEDTVLYGSDMRGGSSGGGWFENFGVPAQGQEGGLFSVPNHIVGVTSYGFVSEEPLVQGSSVLGEDFLKMLEMACDHRPGNC